MLKHGMRLNCALALLTGIGLLFSASAQSTTYRKCATVPNSNGEIDGDNRACGETRENPGKAGGVVQCAYVSVTVPPGWQHLSYRRTKDNIGWAAWLDEINVEKQADGTAVLSTGLKNWSHNLARNFCLEVDAD